MDKSIDFFLIDSDPKTHEKWKSNLMGIDKGDGSSFKYIEIEDVAGSEAPVLVVDGGDGSLNYSINWLFRHDLVSKVKVLYHPNGTGNDFARGVGLRPNDLEQGLRMIHSDSFERINVVEFNEQAFVNVGTFGVFAQVTPEVDPQVKNFIGRLSYFLGGLKKLTELGTWKGSFETDSGSFSEEAFYGFFIGNSRYAGGGMKVVPDQSPRQPTFDLFLIREMPLPRLLDLGIEMQKPTPSIDDFDIELKTLTNLEFNLSKEIDITLDGEGLVAVNGKVSIKNQKVQIFLPSGVD